MSTHYIVIKATYSAEHDFHNLLNNSNYGIDCQNNIDNCILELLYDEIEEIVYIKKFCPIFGNEMYRDFFSLTVMREEIYSEYNSKILSLNKLDPFFEGRKGYFKNRMEEDLDPVNSFEKIQRKYRKKKKIHDIDSKIAEAADVRKAKMILEFF